MIASSSIKKEKHLSQILTCSASQIVCMRCGGNGYTKTTPSCYQTCLKCLGRGLVAVENTK